MKARSAAPAVPDPAAIDQASDRLATPSNASMQENLQQERSGGQSPTTALPSLLATVERELPHRTELEGEFGDLSDVHAHTGPEAGRIVAGMGATGVAFDDHVAFASEDPSIEVVRHELTHVKGGDEDEAHASEDESTTDAGDKPRLPDDRRELRFRQPAEDVDMDDLAVTGAAAGATSLTPAQVQDAIAFDNRKWTGAYRSQIRQRLGAEAPAEGSFTEAEIGQIRSIQLGAGVAPQAADGKLGDTTMAILLQSGLSLDLQATGKVNPWDVELVFYPGEFEDLDEWKARVAQAVIDNPEAPYRAITEPSGTGRMYVKHKGSVVDAVNARGGPPLTLKDYGGHTADPTTAGSHTLGAGRALTTASWSNSQIAWGTPVRQRDDGEWEFQDPTSKLWKIATGPKSVLQKPLERSAFEDENQGRDTWLINDFGQQAFAISGTDGQYIHTTPSDEMAMLAGDDPELAASHGCIHIDPAARVELSALGYLQAGVKLTVKNYETHLLPDPMRAAMQQKAAE